MHSDERKRSREGVILLERKAERRKEEKGQKRGKKETREKERLEGGEKD